MELRSTEIDPIKPSWFDLVIYRLFMWRWNPIFERNKHMKYFFWTYMRDWTSKPIQGEHLLKGLEE